MVGDRVSGNLFDVFARCHFPVGHFQVLLGLVWEMGGFLRFELEFKRF